MSNELIDVMREFGVEVRMLGTEDAPSPNSVALGRMLTEIHRLRAELAAARQPAPVVGEDPEQLARRAWGLMPHATMVDGDYCVKREWGNGQTEVFVLFAKAVRDALAVPMVSPSSDQLEGVYYDGGPVDDDWSDDDIRDGILRVRDAILAAQAVQVPDDLQIPEGWALDTLMLYPDMNGRSCYVARLFRNDGHQRTASGEGPEWQDALRSAIEQAKGGQE